MLIDPGLQDAARRTHANAEADSLVAVPGSPVNACPPGIRDHFGLTIPSHMWAVLPYLDSARWPHGAGVLFQP